MSVNLNCFDNIVGITTSTDCECFGSIGGFDSTSGLYLDSLTELGDVFNIINCQNGDSVSEVILKSETEAKNDFMADFNTNLLTHFKIKRNPFNGVVGRPTFKANKTVAYGNYAGVRMYCADVVSGTLTINKVGAVFEKTGSITVHVIDNLNNYHGNFTLPTLANKHKVSTLAEPLVLPLHSPYTENLEYYFMYEATPMNIPKNNEVKCSSCGVFRPFFNTQKPYFNSQTGGQYGWANWLMAGGLYMAKQATDIDDEDFTCLSHTTSNYMYGLTFEVSIDCKANDLICNDHFSFDGANAAIAYAVANAIRYRWAAIILEKLLRSGEINRITMVNRDEKKEQAMMFNEKYMQMMNYLISNLSFQENDCYACYNKYESVVKTIIT